MAVEEIAAIAVAVAAVVVAEAATNVDLLTCLTPDVSSD